MSTLALWIVAHAARCLRIQLASTGKCARLPSLWSQHDPDSTEILSGMVDQRKRLGLLGTETSVPKPHLDSLPVVAVQRGMSQQHRRRLCAVLGHLKEQGIAEAAAVQVYEVTLAGRLLTGDSGA